MRSAALFSFVAIALLGGCFVVYDPGDFQIADGGSAGNGGKGEGGAGATGGNGVGGNGVGGNGGAGQCSTPDKLDGAPVNSPYGEWTWVGVPETLCRDTSTTGFGIRRIENSTKLVIFFSGTGACFNDASCADTAASFNQGDFNTLVSGSGNSGMFDITNAENPVRNWNAVFIPYCTGDLHIGQSEFVVGGKSQVFAGFANVGFDLARIVPTFPNVTEVLLVGISSGGYGALYNYDRIARDFCNVPVVLIDDSGSPMADKFLAPCLQKHFGQLWRTDLTRPADCDGLNQMNGGGGVNLITCLNTKYPSSRFGFISSMTDDQNTVFFGFGQDCNNLNTSTPIPLPGNVYTDGLMDLRMNFMNTARWSTYFVTGSNHIFLQPSKYDSTVSQGTKLTRWVGDMVDIGINVPVHVGP